MCRKTNRNVLLSHVPLFAAALVTAVLATAPGAQADIYRYVTADGVECFTDAPTDKHAVPIVRERKARRRSKERPSPPQPFATADTNRKSPPLAAPSKSLAGAFPSLPVQGVITSPTGLRHDPIDGTLRNHQGIDIAIPEGTPVRPAAAGTVVFSGHRNGYGNTIVVRHPDGMTTLYAHNRLNLAAEGESVGRDTTIAMSGSTGHSTGPHLHFEAWKDGVNLSESFLPPDYPRTITSGSSHRHRNDETIHRITQADGSILYTNY